MFTSYVQGADAVLVASELDARRFGMAIGRYTLPLDDATDASAVAETVLAGDFEIVILRAAAARGDLERDLRAHPALEVLRADTLRYWRRDAALPSHPAPVRGAATELATVRIATPADRAGIERVARLAFDGYGTHYRANPRFDDRLVADGFCEWAVSGLGRVGATTLVVDTGSAVSGFLLADRAGDALEIALNAVAPEAEGRGLYAALLARTLEIAAAEGGRAVWISTQVDNARAMRAWERLAFAPAFDLMTLHVMRRS